MAAFLRGLRSRAYGTVAAVASTTTFAVFTMWHGDSLVPDSKTPHFLARHIGNCDGPNDSTISKPSDILTEHLSFLRSEDDSPIRRSVVELLGRMQLEIRDRVNALEDKHTPDGDEPVHVNIDIDDRRSQGKRGIAMTIQEGKVIEKGGFNITVMSKKLSPGMARQMSANHSALRKTLEDAASKEKDGTEPEDFHMWVCGLSLILHPRHPLAATVHLNYRYFEVLQGGKVVAWWFGGGNDLTPIYFDADDAIKFHRTLKDVCDKHGEELYPQFKTWADEYFYHKARKEARGVGGIFFDDLSSGSKADLFEFVKDCIEAFPRAYFPLLESKLEQPYSDAMREWQGLRHGRYVEFNLIYDRGTKFGFHVPGVNIESVLVSLPINCRWEYKNVPKPFSAEAELLQVLTGPPQDWAAMRTSDEAKQSARRQ